MSKRQELFVSGTPINHVSVHPPWPASLGAQGRDKRLAAEPRSLEEFTGLTVGQAGRQTHTGQTASTLTFPGFQLPFGHYLVNIYLPR